MARQRARTGGAKQELRRVVEGLTEEQAQDLLDYLNLQADSVTLSDAELKLVREGEAAIERGDYVTLDELKRDLDRGA